MAGGWTGWFFRPSASVAQTRVIEFSEIVKMMASGMPDVIDFRESRFSKLTAEPIVILGRYSLRRPDTLVRKVISPIEETVTLNAQTAVLERAGKRRSLSLETIPELAFLYRTLLALTTGRLDTLQESFIIRSSGSAQRWQLDLRPAAVEGVPVRLSHMTVKGANAVIDSLEIVESTTERSVIEFRPVR